MPRHHRLLPTPTSNERGRPLRRPRRSLFFLVVELFGRDYARLWIGMKFRARCALVALGPVCHASPDSSSTSAPHGAVRTVVAGLLGLGSEATSEKTADMPVQAPTK